MRSTKTICFVCDSPNATTLHFGGRSCKACAAFFRRAVTMDMTYDCTTDPPNNCRVHFELRMICRACRYIKCLEAGMKTDLVQARREDRNSPKQTSENGKSERSNSQSQSQPPPVIQVVPNTYYQQNLYEQVPSCSNSNTPSDQIYTVESLDDQYQMTIDHIIRIEAALNDRRRIMYSANARIRDMFGNICECPFDYSDLKLFDFRTFTGFKKPDFIMLYDYATSLLGFEQLDKFEQNHVYRYSCAVDCMIASAYFTQRIGFKEGRLVLFNGEFLTMDPLPLSGEEPDAIKYFSCKEELNLYKTLMPTKISQWQNMAVPFSYLDVSFEEYGILKALTIWHLSHFKLSASGRLVCCAQRDLLLGALHRLCLDRGKNPAERVGNLLLAMSPLIEQVNVMINNFFTITFFDLIKCDPTLVEVVDQHAML